MVSCIVAVRTLAATIIMHLSRKEQVSKKQLVLSVVCAGGVHDHRAGCGRADAALERLRHQHRLCHLQRRHPGALNQMPSSVTVDGAHAVPGPLVCSAKLVSNEGISLLQEDLYQQACVHSLEEALERCARIGYPIMLKASWGGGGKGIRKVGPAFCGHTCYSLHIKRSLVRNMTDRPVESHPGTGCVHVTRRLLTSVRMSVPTRHIFVSAGAERAGRAGNVWAGAGGGARQPGVRDGPGAAVPPPGGPAPVRYVSFFMNWISVPSRPFQVNASCVRAMFALSADKSGDSRACHHLASMLLMHR
jgi:Carbamoyl-phosphate synthase L chain, ATP binding domain